jgi:hypothetical protein
VEVKATIDRFEGNVAVLLINDWADPIVFPAKFLPEGCREGDVLSLYFEIDESTGEKEHRSVSRLIRKLSKEDR